MLEICTGSLESIYAAIEGGAERVEVCAALEVGGLTPSEGYLREALAIPGIRKHVLIRPRSGDFCYTPAEIRMILSDIRLCRELGADGVVVGALRPDGSLDYDACRRFAEAAEGMSLTFHRAFDECADPFAAMEQLIDLGYHRILTSGQAPRAEQALPLLRDLVRQAAGRITIMPGSGVTPQNVRHILETTKATDIHASATLRTLLLHNTELFPGYTATSAEIVAELQAEIAKLR